MSRRTSSRIWAVLGVGVAAIVGLGLLLALLGRGTGLLVPMVTPMTSTPPNDPVVVSVVLNQDTRSIRHSLWLEAVLLDQVMSGLAGQPAPTPDETLQRLINEELVLNGFPLEQEPTAEQVEARVAAMEQTWGVDDAAVVMALEKAGLTRAAFERMVGRLLAVQAGLEVLQSQGYDTTAWLEKQRASAEILLSEEFEDAVAQVLPTAQSPIPTPFLSPIPTPATETPLPTPAVAIPEVAPDFTLERAGGDTFTLTKQLALGPVVLVFFQRCG